MRMRARFIGAFLLSIVFASCDLFFMDVSSYLSSGERGSSNEIFAGLQYVLSDDETYYTVSGTQSSSGHIEIPSTYKGIEVKVVAKNAFSGNDKITSVLLPNTITTIKESAFSNCAALQTCIIPSSVITIENDAFSNCTHVTLFFETYPATGWGSNWNGGRTVINLKDTYWHLLSFDTQGGIPIPSMPVKNDQDISSEDLPIPIKEGSLFDYWYYFSGESKLNLDSPVFSTEISSDRTFYASWK